MIGSSRDGRSYYNSRQGFSHVGGCVLVVSSEGEARRLVLSVIPEPGTRQRCLIVFADAVEEANRHGRDV
jgi:hypothetical protein